MTRSREGFLAKMVDYFGVEGDDEVIDDMPVKKDVQPGAPNAYILTKRDSALKVREEDLQGRQIALSRGQTLLVTREDELTQQIQDHEHAVQALHERSVDLDEGEAALAEEQRQCAKLADVLRVRVDGQIEKQQAVALRERAVERREARQIEVMSSIKLRERAVQKREAELAEKAEKLSESIA